MANMNQFFRGEIISITVTPPSGIDWGQANPTMYAYRDDLDLSSADNIKEAATDATTEISDGNYAKFQQGTGDNNTVFLVNGKQSRQLSDGHYTVELSYGNDDNNRVIVKTNNAFAIVDSMSRFKNKA